MTAAQAVASRVGAPLGHDYAVISLSDRLKPWDVIAARLTAAAAADLVLAIYNPASKTRTWQVGAMRDLLLEHRDPGTPVVIGRDVSGPREEVEGRAAGRPGSRRGRHALPADRRLVADRSGTTIRVFTPSFTYRDALILSRHVTMTIPRGPDRCDAGVARPVLGADVAASTSTPIGTGQTGATYRLTATYATEQPDLPTSFAVKLPRAGRAVRERVALGYRSEDEFYTHDRRRVRMPVPRSFHCDISDDGGDFVLLLADMAPAVQGDQIARLHAGRGALAVRALAGLHGPTWCDPQWMELSPIAMPKPGDATRPRASATSPDGRRHHARPTRRRDERRGPRNPHRRQWRW